MHQNAHLVMCEVCGEVEAGPSHPVGDVDVGHGRDEEAHAGDGVVGRRHVRRRLPVLVPRVLRRTVGEQQSAQLGPPLLRGLVQGGEAPLVRRVHHGAEPDEEGSDVQVAVGGGVVQGDEAALVLRVDVGAVLQEVLSHFEIVVAGSQVQRGGVATLRRKVDNSYVYTRKYDGSRLRHLSLSK